MFSHTVVTTQLPVAFFIFFILILGLEFGSFISVLIDRVPAKENINKRSLCPKCKNELRIRDNIPLISYLVLRGRCHFCQSEISKKYPLLEIVTAAALFIPLFQFDGFWVIAAWEAFVIFGIALSAIDFQSRELPDLLTGPLFLTVTVLLGIDAERSGHGTELRNAAMASIFLFLLFVLIYMVTKGGIGLGDAKLAASIGFLTGYHGLISTYMATITGFTLATLVGLSYITAKGLPTKSNFPFAPFLVVGAIMSVWLTTFIENLRF